MPSEGLVVPGLVSVPMISIALEDDCVSTPRRWGKGEPNYFHALIGGRGFLVRFESGDNDDPFEQLFSTPRDVEHRGRSVMGRVQYAISMHGRRSNVAVLEFAAPSDVADVEQFFRDNFDAVEGWGLRFSRWFDIVYPQAPLHGVTNVTRSLYIHVGLGRSATTMTVGAPDGQPGVVSHVVGLDRPTRVDVQRVIDELADLEVPVALDFIRRARAKFAAGDLLRALMECGTAAEAAIAAQYDLLATGAHGPRWTLGNLIVEASKVTGVLPHDLTKEVLGADLVQVRNRAVHSGDATRGTAELALERAERIVDHVYGTEASGDEAEDAKRVGDLRNRVIALHP